MLVNEHWITLSSHSLVQHLNLPSSDHSPLLLSFGKHFFSGPRCFRFQYMWIRRLDYLQVVSDNYKLAYYSFGMSRFCWKLKRLKIAL